MNSQQSHPNVTPKSAAFGSPIATQESWTARPRRRQVQQKAKASFLSDDEDDDDQEDRQNDNLVMTNPPKQSYGDHHVDQVSDDFESGLNAESDEEQSIQNQSPTLRASQAARLPPQSAQIPPRSSTTGSSDKFSVFEALKKKPLAAAASKIPPKMTENHEPPPQKQERALATRDQPARDGNKGRPVKETSPRQRAASRRSLANSKVKLTALEVEEETEDRKPDVKKSLEHDYSLPASNSSSPAAAPAKKKPAARKRAVKEPPPKPKMNTREANAATRGRPRIAKLAPAPSTHKSPEVHSDEVENVDLLLAEEPSTATQVSKQANQLPQTKHQKLEPGDSPDEGQEDVIMVSSDSVSSFPELDNAEDEDFECPRKMTPSNARRRTRAAAAESQAAKEAKRKVESRPAALPSTRPRETEDERSQSDSAGRPKMQRKQPPKNSAVEKTQVVATHTKPDLKSTEELKSPAEKPMKKGSASERKAAASRASGSRSQVKQETVASSTVGRVGRGEASKHFQTSEPVKPTKDFFRKPNIVAFGSGGPKNNGRPHKTTATTDSRPQGAQSGPSNGEQPAGAKSQAAKGAKKGPKSQSNTTVQDGDSSTEDFVDSAEGGTGQATRAPQSTVAPIVSDNTPSSKAETQAGAPNFDEETTRLDYEIDCSDAPDPFVTIDAEADRAVEVAATAIEGFLDDQNHGVADAFENHGDGKVPTPLVQADVEPLHRDGQRAALGEIDMNRRDRPQVVSAAVPQLMKRKRQEVVTVEERSPNPQAQALKSGSQSGSFPTWRMNSAASHMAAEGHDRPVKKPRLQSSYAARVDHDADYTGSLFGGPDSLSRRVDGDTGDDVFGPRKKNQASKSSAFVQRLINNKSADRGQAGSRAPASDDAPAAHRQHPSAINHSATVRPEASQLAPCPRRSQQSDDVRKRMLAALGPEKLQVASPSPPSGEYTKECRVGDTNGSWLSDTSDQRRASEVDERTRVWKKATEPYADSLGETMHKIVNVS